MKRRLNGTRLTLAGKCDLRMNNVRVQSEALKSRALAAAATSSSMI